MTFGNALTFIVALLVLYTPLGYTGDIDVTGGGTINYTDNNASAVINANPATPIGGTTISIANGVTMGAGTTYGLYLDQLDTNTNSGGLTINNDGTITGGAPVGNGADKQRSAIQNNYGGASFLSGGLTIVNSSTGVINGNGSSGIMLETTGVTPGKTIGTVTVKNYGTITTDVTVRSSMHGVSAGSNILLLDNYGSIISKAENGYGITAREGSVVTLHNGSSVQTTGNSMSSGVSLYKGTVTVNDGATITIEGSGMLAGVDNAGNGAIVTVNGDIVASGSGGQGILGVNGSGQTISIGSTGSISTTGDDSSGASNGIYLMSVYDSAISIAEGGSIKTTGDSAKGIYANSNSTGNTYTIGGSIRTSGSDAFGVQFDGASNNKVTISSTGSITTDGDDACGFSLVNSDNNIIEISAGGSILTNEAQGHGIYVDEDSSGNTYTIGGSIGTTEEESHGIFLDENSVNNTVTISSGGSITTGGTSHDDTGCESHGIFADEGSSGNTISVDGAITTWEDDSSGIYLDEVNNNTITASSTAVIKTYGDSSYGISLEGKNNSVNFAGTIIVTGEDSAGISMDNSSGDENIRDTLVFSGKITTLGEGSEGLEVEEYADISTTSTSVIETSGYYGTAIEVDKGSTVTLAGSIITNGQAGHGVDLSADNSHLTMASTASINVKNTTDDPDLDEIPHGVYVGRGTSHTITIDSGAEVKSAIGAGMYFSGGGATSADIVNKGLISGTAKGAILLGEGGRDVDLNIDNDGSMVGGINLKNLSSDIAVQGSTSVGDITSLAENGETVKVFIGYKNWMTEAADKDGTIGSFTGTAGAVHQVWIAGGGTVDGNIIFGAADSDKISFSESSGGKVTGNVNMGAGDDYFAFNTSGEITGNVDMGAASNEISLGDGVEAIFKGDVVATGGTLNLLCDGFGGDSTISSASGKTLTFDTVSVSDSNLVTAGEGTFNLGAIGATANNITAGAAVNNINYNGVHTGTLGITGAVANISNATNIQGNMNIAAGKKIVIADNGGDLTVANSKKLTISVTDNGAGLIESGDNIDISNGMVINTTVTQVGSSRLLTETADGKITYNKNNIIINEDSFLLSFATEFDNTSGSASYMNLVASVNTEKVKKAVGGGGKGKTLEKIVSDLPADDPVKKAIIELGSEAEIEKASEALFDSHDTASSIGGTSMVSVRQANVTMRNQFTAFRMGNLSMAAASSFAGAGSTAAINDMADPDDMVVAFDESSSIIDTTPYNSWTGFAKAYGGFGEQGNSGEDIGYDFGYAGVMAGLDYAFAEEFRAGVLIGYSYSNSTMYRNQGNGSDNTIRIGPYVSYNYDGIFLDSAATVGAHILETNRNISFTGFRTTATGERTGVDFNWMNTVGYDFEIPGGIILTPSYGLDFTVMYDPKYTETGGAKSAMMIVDERTTYSLTQKIDIKLGKVFRKSDKLALLPEIWGGWEHEYLGGGEISATNASVLTNSWTEEVSTIAPDRATFGGAVTALINDNIAVFGRYDMKIWDKGYESSFSAGIKIQF